MRKFFFSVLLLMTVFSTAGIFAQLAGEYQSKGSGLWSDPATWQKYDGLQWNDASDYPVTGTTAKISVLSGHTVTLTSAITVKTLVLEGVVVTTSVNLLTISNIGTITGGSQTAYIDGPLARIVAGTGLKTLNFPVGKTGTGRPVIYKVGHSVTTSTVYTVEMFNAAPPANNIPAPLTSVSGVRYYSIHKSAPSVRSQGTLTLSYGTDDLVENPFDLRIVRDDGAGNWVDMGGTGTAPVTGTITSTGTLPHPFPLTTNRIYFALASTLFQPLISGNTGVAGALIKWTDVTAKTMLSDGNGNYSFKVTNNWSGTVIPSAPGYRFVPDSIVYSGVTSDRTAQNYTAVSLYNDYRAIMTGDWIDPAIWEVKDGDNWIPSPNYPVSVTGTVTIDTALEVAVNNPISIANGGTLINKGVLNTGAALTVLAGGSLINQGELFNPNVGTPASPSHPGMLYVHGTYEHAQDGGQIGLAGNFGYSHTTWYAGSVIRVTGMVWAAPTAPTQSALYSATMIWDCPNQSTDAFMNFRSDYYYTAGSFTLLNSNSHQVYLFSGQGETMGHVVVDGPQSRLTAFTSLSTGIQYPFFSYFRSLTVQNGGEFFISTVPGNANSLGTINISGDLTVLNGGKLGNYSNPYFGGISYSHFVFPGNPANTPHNINLSGLAPVTGVNDSTNMLNFTVNHQAVLHSPVTARLLTLNAALVSNSNLITILPGGNFTVGNGTIFTDGPVAFQVASADTALLTFPIGKGGTAYPLTLKLQNPSDELTVFTAEMLSGAPPVNLLPAGLGSVASNRYYTLTGSAAAQPLFASVTVPYDAADNVADHLKLRIARDDGAGNWIDMGGQGTAASFGTITSSGNIFSSPGSIIVLAESAIPAGLISYWSLDEKTGGAYADFMHVNNATGSSIPDSGKVGSAQGFDGTVSKISAPAHPSLDFAASADFSYEYWYKGESAPVALTAVIGRPSNENRSVWYSAIKPNSGRAIVYMSGGGQSLTLEGTSITDGKWHHVAVTRNGTTGNVTLYVDGVQRAKAAKIFTSDFSSPTARLEIGSIYNSRLLNGILDEVALFGVELSADEILQHYSFGLKGMSYFAKSAPVIISTPKTTATAGVPYSYHVEAVGSPIPVYSLVTFPVGMVIDSLTGLIEWTPLSAGDFEVTVEAKNGVSPSAVQSFVIAAGDTFSVPASLVSYWSLDEQAGGGTYADFRNVNNATGSSIPDSGKVGSAQGFDGTVSKISAPAHPSLDFAAASDFSYEYWYKGESAPVALTAVMGRPSNENRSVWYSAIKPGSGRAIVYMSGGGQSVTMEGTSITDGKWHHVAVTRNGTTGNIFLYIDGVLKAQSTRIFTADFSSPTARLEIGSIYNSRLLKGILDEVALHNTELSADEILQHYNYGTAGLNYWGRTFLGKIKAAANPVFDRFTASTESRQINLNWQTRTAVNGRFEVERRAGIEEKWTNAGMVTASGIKTFSLKDNVNSDGKYSYRIKFTSDKGGYAYSEISDVNILPLDFNLAQNYPNPFNPATTIKYDLPSESRVNITIFNTIGEKVAGLVNNVQPAGRYTQQWNAGRLASGVYLLRIEAKEVSSNRSFVKVLKMMLLK